MSFDGVIAVAEAKFEVGRVKRAFNTGGIDRCDGLTVEDTRTTRFGAHCSDARDATLCSIDSTSACRAALELCTGHEFNHQMLGTRSAMSFRELARMEIRNSKTPCRI